MTITIETYAGARTAERALPWSIDDARAAIRELDGHATTLLALEQSGHSLWIAGGPDRFTVTYTTPNTEKAYSLIPNPEVKGTEPRVMGGQLVDQPIRELVSRDAAEKAAAEFVETGIVRLSPEWEDQDQASPTS